MKIVMGYASSESLGMDPRSSHIRAFNKLGRIPSIGEHIRFNNKNCKVLSVITDLDNERIVIAVSDPL